MKQKIMRPIAALLAITVLLGACKPKAIDEATLEPGASSAVSEQPTPSPSPGISSEEVLNQFLNALEQNDLSGAQAHIWPFSEQLAGYDAGNYAQALMNEWSTAGMTKLKSHTLQKRDGSSVDYQIFDAQLTFDAVAISEAHDVTIEDDNQAPPLEEEAFPDLPEESAPPLEEAEEVTVEGENVPMTIDMTFTVVTVEGKAMVSVDNILAAFENTAPVTAAASSVAAKIDRVVVKSDGLDVSISVQNSSEQLLTLGSESDDFRIVLQAIDGVSYTPDPTIAAEIEQADLEIEALETQAVVPAEPEKEKIAVSDEIAKLYPEEIRAAEEAMDEPLPPEFSGELDTLIPYLTVEASKTSTFVASFVGHAQSITGIYITAALLGEESIDLDVQYSGLQPISGGLTSIANPFA